MSSMRPRGLSASSPVARNVGHAWRQKPQWTQESSAANPPRASATASTGTVLAFDRDRDRVSGIEGVPQPRDEGAHAFAVGAEVAHGAAQRPGDRKSTRLNSSHLVISYAVFCLKKKRSGSS